MRLNWSVDSDTLRPARGKRLRGAVGYPAPRGPLPQVPVTFTLGITHKRSLSCTNICTT